MRSNSPITQRELRLLDCVTLMSTTESPGN